jgi:transporter family-2 protein
MNPGQHAAFWPIAFLMLVAGIGIPIMATLNAGIGQQLQSPVAATVILFGVGLVIAGVALAFAGVPGAVEFRAVEPWRLLGAVLVVFYILSVTWAAPRIGVGNAIFFVLVGQLIAAAVIDHYGLWGAIQSSLTWRRAIGIGVMMIGVYLARKTT